MSVSRRVELQLPPNGTQLSERVASEVLADLKRCFREALAYPNANVKVQWSASFYSKPNHHEGEVNLLVRTEGVTVNQLEDEGLTPTVEMGSLEIGVPSGGSPAITRPGLPSRSSQPVATESKGRRDVGARQGRGIEFSAGQPVNESLGNVDGRNVAGDVAKALEDVPKSDKQVIMKEDSLVISEDAVQESSERVKNE